MNDITRGPPIPIPPYRGTRYDPKDAWLFSKGIYGPPDLRIIRMRKPAMDGLWKKRDGWLVVTDTIERFISRGWIKREVVASEKFWMEINQ